MSKIPDPKPLERLRKPAPPPPPTPRVSRDPGWEGPLGLSIAVVVFFAVMVLA